MELAIDTVVGGRYRVEERLGAGAMGVVYRVRHTKLFRPFAIKVLHPSLSANAKLVRRFQREAEIASSLRHRNVVGVVDVGEYDNLAYLVMELADGAPLSATMLESPLPAPTVIDCARQLCDGLQHAHDAGLIHRDFKPDNVIVERDKSRGSLTLRIIDFGIAMLRDEASAAERERLTTEGIVLGTPHYMAPEHASGAAVDHRIDLFALGVICFEMLTGKMPFDGDGVDVARANIMYDAPAMGVRVPDLDVDPLLEAFTRKLMARQRDRRFASAKAAREVLDLIEHDRALAAAALGVKSAQPTTHPTNPPMTSRPMLAIPIVTPRRSASNTLEPLQSSTLPAEAPAGTDKIQPMRRRFRTSMIGAAIVTLVMVVAVGMTWGERHAASQIADTAEHPSPAIVLNATQPPVHEAPPPVVDEPEPAPHPIVPKPSPPAKRVAKPVVSQNLGETSVDAPTAVEVAQLYGLVGRALGQLQQTKGSDATIDLWPRFRHIRINDGIATHTSRRETHQTLVRLQRDVTSRRTP